MATPGDCFVAGAPRNDKGGALQAPFPLSLRALRPLSFCPQIFLCHSEEAKRPKNLAQDRLRLAISGKAKLKNQRAKKGRFLPFIVSRITSYKNPSKSPFRKGSSTPP
jgi:hypothetical protein